jgi:hypothetical protein
MIHPQDFEIARERRALAIINTVALALLVAMVVYFWTGPASTEEPDVAVWLARSCVGEAGWTAHASGECAGIWHIYRKRAERSGRSVYTVAHMYSAAIKPRAQRRNRWVLHMDRTAERPQYWPALPWRAYAAAWVSTLELADRFLAGDVPDPVPDADHYGSQVDRWRAIRAGWKFIRTGFRNQFWRVPKKTR